jgi:hypothetical protein
MDSTPDTGATLVIDHVVWAGSSLAKLVRTFEKLQLPPQYGGRHANGATEMSLIGFDDGTYLELISTLEPEADAPWWQDAIQQDGGPCAWAVWVEDIQREARWAFDQGLDVRGPLAHSRKRPDGQTLEWDMAYLGRGEIGAVLPFLISDRTDHDLRAAPTHGVSGTELTGISSVILGVRSLAAAAADFKRWAGWGSIQLTLNARLDAKLAHFPGQPFLLAEPLNEDGWLARRLDQFGESPCAVLLESSDMDESLVRLALGPEEVWLGQRLAWFDPAETGGHLLGVVSPPEPDWSS